VQLLWGAPWRDGDARLRGLQEDGACVEDLGGEGLDRDAGVGALGQEGVVDWGWASQTFFGGGGWFKDVNDL
jgi:hypothetical protein